MTEKHMKLIGGSLNTARHDLERMKTVREVVDKMNKEERERDYARKSRSFGTDIDWVEFGTT